MKGMLLYIIRHQVVVMTRVYYLVAAVAAVAAKDIRRIAAGGSTHCRQVTGREPFPGNRYGIPLFIREVIPLYGVLVLHLPIAAQHIQR